MPYDNGTIVGESGEYIIKPVRPGKTLVTVKAGGKTVRETELRVIDDITAALPDGKLRKVPAAMVFTID